MRSVSEGEPGPLRGAGWLARGLPLAALLSGALLWPRPAAAETPSRSARDSFAGLYLGVDAKVTRLAGGQAFLIGPHLGWVLVSDVSLGLGLYTSTHAVRAPDAGDPTSTLRMTYGTLRAGYVFFSASPIHLTPALLFGAGGVSIVPPGSDGEGAVVFTLEPTLELELAPPSWRFVHLGASVTYRVAALPEVGGVTARELSFPSASAFVRLGFF